MKMVPVFKCRNMQQALQFYTNTLDFQLKHGNISDEDTVVEIVKENIEIQLTMHESESLFGSVVNIFVEDVDQLFEHFLSRGLDISGKENSPVHQGPVDQSWGNREFYVTDSDGNSLRFCKPFQLPKAIYLDAWPYKEGRLMNLPVANLRTALSFYIDVMNFKKEVLIDTGVSSIVLARDKVRIGIAENGGDPGQEGVFFEVDNIENAMKELRLNGMKKNLSEINIEMHEETEWKTFYILAPDGLCYCIGEKI